MDVRMDVRMGMLAICKVRNLTITTSSLFTIFLAPALAVTDLPCVFSSCPRMSRLA